MRFVEVDEGVLINPDHIEMIWEVYEGPVKTKIRFVSGEYCHIRDKSVGDILELLEPKPIPLFDKPLEYVPDEPGD